MHAAIGFYVISRSAGKSAVAASAYRTHSELYDERYDKTHYYSRKKHGIHSEVLAPGDAPAWASDRQQLWNEVERVEKRKDAQLAREVLLTLPRGFTPREYMQMVRNFVDEAFVSQGMVADIGIEAPPADDGQLNWHAHVMLTMRELGPDGFGNKNREWNRTEFLEASRALYQFHLNKWADTTGLDHRFDLRSNEERGLGEPQPKMGPAVTQMERRGVQTYKGDERARVKQRNFVNGQKPRNPLALSNVMDDLGRRYYQFAYGAEWAYSDRGYGQDWYGNGR